MLELVVRPSLIAATQQSIESVHWSGLRCRAEVSGANPGWAVDLRTKASDPGSSLVLDGKPQLVGEDGFGSLVVEDPDHEGIAAIVVLLDQNGRVAAKLHTIVGGNE